MSVSCKFPEKRRLDVSSNFILSNLNFRLKAKEIVDDFLSTQKGASSISVPTVLTVTANSWKERSEQIKTSLIKQASFLKRQIVINREHLKHKRSTLLKFIKLARINSSLAGDLLHEGKGGVSNGRGSCIQRQKVRCCQVVKGQQCTETALLYSKYCLEHITADKQQMLYQSCVATDNETFTKCNRPVLEILQDKPYCLKHIPATKIETKKTLLKLMPPSAKIQGQGTKRKVSPGRQKIKEVTKKPVILQQPNPLSIPSPLHTSPLLNQPSLSLLLPSLNTPTWSSLDNEGDNKSRPGDISMNVNDPMGTNDNNYSPLLPPTQVNEGLPSFSSPPPPTLTMPPPILLLPPDPTPGSFLDDSSSNEDNS